MRHPPPGRLTLLLLALMMPFLAHAQSPDTALLDALMARLAAVPQRRATFTEERHFAALTTALHSEGWLLYQHPSFLQKMTTGPVVENLTVQDDTLRDTPANQGERIVSLGSQPVIEALVDAVRGPLSGDLPMLRKHYEVTASGTLESWHLILLPTEGEVRQMVHDVAIDGTGTDIHVIRTTQANGDTQTMMIAPAP
jgi:Outer membrane lipoprotein carrier protein LolA-like